MLQFNASPSFSWTAYWQSSWWRQAAGLLQIGQFIGRFD
jgi:isocitrate lyase